MSQLLHGLSFYICMNKYSAGHSKQKMLPIRLSRMLENIYRIACDLGIPVWYFTVKNKPATGYYMEISKLQLEIPAEGLSGYVKLAEADILSAPAAWQFMPGFKNWPYEPTPST